jgi:hypothetical protein
MQPVCPVQTVIHGSGHSHGASAVNVIPFYRRYPMRFMLHADENRTEEFFDAFFRLERLHFS